MTIAGIVESYFVYRFEQSHKRGILPEGDSIYFDVPNLRADLTYGFREGQVRLTA